MTKILVVEDDKFLRELIVKKLNRDGFETLEANDGEEGFRNTISEKPDLILLDLILPGMDGFEVLSKIKADSVSKDIPIIVLSNLGQREDVERCMALGASDYMIKAHFTPVEIVEKIKRVLKI